MLPARKTGDRAAFSVVVFVQLKNCLLCGGNLLDFYRKQYDNGLKNGKGKKKHEKKSTDPLSGK